MEGERGTLYGVSVGPGDPELLTLKAVRVLTRCPVIAAPQTGNGETLALNIARQAVDLADKTILPLPFAMEREEARRRTVHEAAAAVLEPWLARGQDVAVVNLGDVSIYASFSYLMELLRAKGFRCVMVPGVPSFCAVAARLETSLTSMNAPLHIVPAGGGPLRETLALPGAKVLMKSASRMGQVLDTLRQEGLLERSAMVQDCGLPTEAVYPSLTEVPEGAGYFATILVKE